MAITTLGFEGSIDDVAYSKRSRFEGAAFPVVDGRADYSVTNGSADRSVNVAPGTACAHAIVATSDTTATLQLAAVTLANAIRWDAIVLRYVWSANTVTLVVVPGTAALNAQPTLPSGLRYDVGDTYDQVLALVKVQQGLTAVQQINDRRLQATKVFTALSKENLPPAIPSAYGAEVVTADGTRWRCGLDSSSNLAWLATTVTVAEITGTAVIKTVQTGWTVDTGTSPHVNRCVVRPYSRQIDLEVRRTGAEINAANADGNFNDTPVVVLQDTCKPDRPMPVRINYITTDGKEFGGDARLDPDGTLMLLGGAVARNLAQSGTAGTVSLRASIRFDRKAA